jgi:transcriptional antiterminator Rof (Rho-off)
MLDSDAYQPVACGFYDELGLRMMRGRSCTLVVDDGGGAETTEAVIEDVFTDGDAEYVRLDDDRRIRLDHIQRVDDVPRPGAC